jgi:glycosyltransferase involved in cell wall biosynthesis
VKRSLLDRLRELRYTSTPRHAWSTHVRRAIGAMPLGEVLRRSRGLVRLRTGSTGTGSWDELPSPSARRRGRNVLLVSHCDFTGNGAVHVFAIATELARRGWSPVIAVPNAPGGVRDLGEPAFPVVSYRQAERSRNLFPDGRQADLIHAFTPRERVRAFVTTMAAAHDAPYVVHLEDNEEAVLAGELGASVEALRAMPESRLDQLVRASHAHPARASAFISRAGGMTVVIDRLLELKPDGIPGIVAWPGYDLAGDVDGADRDRMRAHLGIGDGDLAITYTGNIHRTNLDEVRSLFLAVAQLRARTLPVVLIRSGWSSVARRALPSLGGGIRNVGWVARRRVPDLLAAADILVQPGAPGSFNDYRFPSKLPEFLASGKPVVLPRSNIGLELRDGVDVLLLQRGDPDEIAAAVERLALDVELRRQLGAASRAFAVRELRWESSVEKIETLYGEVLAGLTSD